MSISEQQLETWSHQGSITQSSDTYQSVKSVLESPSAPYYDKLFTVFLQGSYGNDTNIRTESDVDIVIRLDSSYDQDISRLTETQKQLYNSATTPATYVLSDFKRDVVTVLRNAYGTDVIVGEKAIQIAPRNGRRKTDVIVAIQYRKYETFINWENQSYIEGIRFWTTRYVEIINYPKQHSSNLTRKHQSTNSWLKPTVRIFKNMRRQMIERGLLEEGTAPSYFIEGLLYNVPAEQFGHSYSNTVVNCINWLLNANRDEFLCANEQYFLCHDTSPVTWRAAKRDAFIAASANFWRSWS